MQRLDRQKGLQEQARRDHGRRDDIFNQNKGLRPFDGSGWTQNSTNSVIGRYYMVQFTYNLRRFGKKGSKNIKDYDGVAQPSGSRRMGPGGRAAPPPGMFHGPR